MSDGSALRPAVSVRKNSPISSRRALITGSLSLCSGLLLIIGTQLPYFTTSIFGLTSQRDAFELGLHRTVTYTGPCIVFFGVAALVFGLVQLRASRFKRNHWWWPIGLSFFAAIFVLDAWFGHFAVIAGASVARGSGLVMSLVGAVLLFCVGIFLVVANFI
jgi:hypothetical protein